MLKETNIDMKRIYDRDDLTLNCARQLLYILRLHVDLTCNPEKYRGKISTQEKRPVEEVYINMKEINQ